MTIAIGATFDGGAIVCSDTKVSASDGATSYGSKQFLGISATRKMYALANSGEDAHAAKMLGSEISNAISGTDKSTRVEPAIKKVMETWYNGYRHVHPPQIQFVLALIQEGWEQAALLYCEPPNTVAHGSPIAVGKGSRAVDPVLQILAPVAHEKMDARSALLRVAYLMHLAKRDEGAACGGDTYGAAISAGGGYTLIDEEEMKEAEERARWLDKSIESGIRVFTGSSQSALGRYPYPESLNAAVEALKKLEFPSLKFIEGHELWKKKGKNKQAKPARVGRRSPQALS